MCFHHGPLLSEPPGLGAGALTAVDGGGLAGVPGAGTLGGTSAVVDGVAVGRVVSWVVGVVVLGGGIDTDAVALVGVFAGGVEPLDCRSRARTTTARTIRPAAMSTEVRSCHFVAAGMG